MYFFAEQCKHPHFFTINGVKLCQSMCYDEDRRWLKNTKKQRKTGYIILSSEIPTMKPLD